MVLPTVTNFVDATDFSKTISPALSQLSWTHVKPLLTRDVAPLDWYLSTNPFITGLLFTLLVSALCFFAQEITHNHSQVDRLWSILPIIHVGNFTLYGHLAPEVADTQRLDTLMTFVTLWGVRLTYNFWRKGGYQKGSEDYRHSILRQQHIPKSLHWVWSLTFLAFAQNIIIYAFCAPAYIILMLGTIPAKEPSDTFGTMDTIISQSLVILLLLEIVADQQQWGFQTAKAEYKKTGNVPHGYSQEDLERGFVVSGLWGLSRHPNFACEQAIWCGIYLWTCLVTDVMFNWSAVGAISLLAIFQGSTPFTEHITSEKYPQYADYQRLVARFVPGFATLVGSGKAEKEAEMREEVEKAKAAELKRREEEKPVPKRRSQRKK